LLVLGRSALFLPAAFPSSSPPPPPHIAPHSTTTSSFHLFNSLSLSSEEWKHTLLISTVVSFFCISTQRTSAAPSQVACHIFSRRAPFKVENSLYSKNLSRQYVQNEWHKTTTTTTTTTTTAAAAKSSS
jgi:hypothetical protein